MDVFGTVQGAAARKFRGYTYIQVIGRGYGRTAKFVEAADYRVTLGLAASSGLAPVQLWMETNHNTEAGEPLLALTLWVSGGCELRQELCDEAVRIAFA